MEHTYRGHTFILKRINDVKVNISYKDKEGALLILDDGKFNFNIGHRKIMEGSFTDAHTVINRCCDAIYHNYMNYIDRSKEKLDKFFDREE